MDRLTREMNEYSLQTIGWNLARAEEERALEAARKPEREERRLRQQGLKFKPKAPAQRYFERHPEAAATKEASGVDVDMSDDDGALSDEAEYVTETYVRMAAGGRPDESVSPDKVGLLVLETEPEVDFFYGNEDSDSDDEYVDDEDENGMLLPQSPSPSPSLSPPLRRFKLTQPIAENYYTADYPDDEVESDDEYNVDPYRFTQDKDEFEVSNDVDSSEPEEDGDDRGFREMVIRRVGEL